MPAEQMGRQYRRGEQVFHWESEGTLGDPGRAFKHSLASVVLPAPFGPAMITIFCSPPAIDPAHHRLISAAYRYHIFYKICPGSGRKFCRSSYDLMHYGNYHM
jgi:hypothetical protein